MGGVSFYLSLIRAKTSDDIACDSIVEYAEELEKSLDVVHNNLSSLLEQRKDVAKHYYELGLSWQLLGCYEKKQDEEQLGALASEFGSICDSISDTVSKASDEDNIHFRELIKIQLKTANALQDMMKSRSAQNITYQTALNTLDSKNEALEKNKKPNKTDLLTEQVQLAESTTDKEKKILDQITSSCMAEASIYRKDKEKDMKSMIINFVNHQVKYHQELASKWQEMLNN